MTHTKSRVTLELDKYNALLDDRAILLEACKATKYHLNNGNFKYGAELDSQDIALLTSLSDTLTQVINGIEKE